MNAQHKKEMEEKIQAFNALDLELRKTQELMSYLRAEINGDMSEQGRIFKIEIHRQRWSTCPPKRAPLKTPLTITIPFDEFLFSDAQVSDWMMPILQKKADRLREKIEKL